jgi:site-specific recombinase XerD
MDPQQNRLPQSDVRHHSRLEEVLEARIQNLATTLRPRTADGYRYIVGGFLSYVRTAFPQLCAPAELRRDPHLLGWFRHLCEQTPPLANQTRRQRLMLVRRLLLDLASQGLVQPGLILLEDFPPEDKYLPKPLSPAQDEQLQQELRRTNDIFSNALLLTRATGMRVGECIDLPKDCIRSLGEDQWALHVPLGKLHTERLVPVDEDARDILTRILRLRESFRSRRRDHPLQLTNFLLPRSGTHLGVYLRLRHALHKAAKRAGITNQINCHQLRHTYGTEMIRLGVSLPVLMKLLGHKDIRMTMRYLQVTLQDLQREFQMASEIASRRHFVPKLPLPHPSPPALSGLSGIKEAVSAARHLLEMYRRDLSDVSPQRHLRRLENRLTAIARELDLFGKRGK